MIFDRLLSTSSGCHPHHQNEFLSKQFLMMKESAGYLYFMTKYSEGSYKWPLSSVISEVFSFLLKLSEVGKNFEKMVSALQPFPPRKFANVGDKQNVRMPFWRLFLALAVFHIRDVLLVGTGVRLKNLWFTMIHCEAGSVRRCLKISSLGLRVFGAMGS